MPLNILLSEICTTGQMRKCFTTTDGYSQFNHIIYKLGHFMHIAHIELEKKPTPFKYERNPLVSIEKISSSQTISITLN